ncbi:MAG: tryptophan synthase subunit alpha [Firmicutes bacterium]|jgi:tryptophan synthase alpha chain|nr:tryptophan synthase subunit alpha [Bacillota bacterium]
MNRLEECFRKLRGERRKALMPYLTAGDPDLDVSFDLALACEQGGADLLELGIPFSDPLADGPTVQEAVQRSLDSGTTFAGILELTRRIRRVSEMPIVFLAYYNSVYSRGEAQFVQACADAGADGLVIPDLPPEEAGNLLAEADRHNITVVQMLAPTSTSERIDLVSKLAEGFIYCVSVTGVTGARDTLSDTLAAFLKRVRALTATPLMVGFGISSPEQAVQAAQEADGVIVGSALIKRISRVRELEGTPHAIKEAERFVNSLRHALDNTV